jgi:hypothetical protein
MRKMLKNNSGRTTNLNQALLKGNSRRPQLYIKRRSNMKRVAFCGVLFVSLIISSVVKADSITDAEVQSLNQQAQAAENNAAIADAQGNSMRAAQLRATADSLRSQAANMQSMSNTVHQDEQQILNAINNGR